MSTKINKQPSSRLTLRRACGLFWVYCRAECYVSLLLVIVGK